jgi:hypothetical protein
MSELPPICHARSKSPERKVKPCKKELANGHFHTPN